MRNIEYENLKKWFSKWFASITYHKKSATGLVLISLKHIDVV